MKFYRKIWYFLASLFVKSNSKYYLSACAIFNDDAKYLPEWIEFHIKQGVQHFYLYNNNSPDDYNKILNKYLSCGLITIIQWNYSYKNSHDWVPLQCKAYMHCIKVYGRNSKWISFLDTDEFLFCPDRILLNTKLIEYESSVAIGVNWVMYGTSNVEKISNGSLLNSLLYRGLMNFDSNAHVKCIVQPKYVENCFNPHFFVYRKKKLAVTENLESLDLHRSKTVSVNIFRINHYWTRDMDFFLNTKIPRRKKWGYDSAVEIETEKDLNQIYDPILCNTCCRNSSITASCTNSKCTSSN